MKLEATNLIHIPFWLGKWQSNGSHEVEKTFVKSKIVIHSRSKEGFIYSFWYSLSSSSSIHHLQITNLEGFHNHLAIFLLFFCCVCYMKRNAAFTLISFVVLKWDDCLSFQLPVELQVEITVQLHLELEMNWLVQNVNELQFELSRM